MRVICTAVLENEPQRNNLRQCIGIIGGKPDVSGETVCVEYEGSSNVAQKFIELFEQYVTHEIKILS